MTRRLCDVTLDNLGRVPPEALGAVFWEVAEDETAVDARFQKEEWFSSTLLEWGGCGKLLVDEEGEALGFAEYAPPGLFPRLSRYRCGRVSTDAVYLAYCYVVPGHRGRRVGTELVRAVARDLVDRGFRALEALGENQWTGGWVLPGAFLASNRFTVIREDDRVPLWRLDLLRASAPMESEEVVALALPAHSGAGR